MCQGFFFDIVFQLVDGSFAAHWPMLMAYCDMMKAMFSGDFRENSAKALSSFQFIIFLTLTL
jgi:Rho-related BTB domain-containing protein 1/2